MGVRINKRLVDSLKPKGEEFFEWDSELHGFGIRVRPSGAMSYVAKYRVGRGRGAPTRRVTIAPVGKVTPEEARTLAKRVIADAVRGHDTGEERKKAREAPTLSEVADQFLAQHVLAKRKTTTAISYAGVIKRDIKPALGSRKADSISRADVARLHTNMADRPIQANRMLAIMGKLFAWAGGRGLVAEGLNPARGIEKYRENGRERFLTTEELTRLGAALIEAETVGIPYEVDETSPKAKHAPKPENRRVVLGPHAVAAIRLLLFTGARLREILHLQWSQVDFERGIAFLPDTKTGQKRLMLSTAALRVLADLPRVGKFVIVGASAGAERERPRADLQRPWALVARRAGFIERAAEVTPEGKPVADEHGAPVVVERATVRLHDLRHSFASVGAGSGLGLTIVGKLLGHAQPATTARYSHLDADPLRRAADSISDKISAAMEGRATALVIPAFGRAPQ
ncbi:UNVERIFIED_ORG: integrase [Xanthobacter viscosus]|uniref:DUF4102 domain-containing protein n=1 Tax=Xanthobacter autotrophicus TaxID=280 RepID=A0A6C1KH58_XANAU|nr:site-specific integrase [Xanthobacter autotrophicus]TLX43612.1 DUF4102 domain-containing protein [Xanthobacter autotrophicus]